MSPQPEPNGHKPYPKGARAHQKGAYPQLDAEYAERQKRCVQLRMAGVPFSVIAEEVGYADKSSAYRAWRAAISDAPKALADEARRLEDERLDSMLASIWAEVRRGKPWAIDRALRISESRRRLWGLDAPIRHDVGFSDALDREIKDLVEALEGLD